MNFRKFAALADITTVLPDLTETELRRLLALAHGLRRERTPARESVRATTLASEALPAVEAAALALDRREQLYAASLALYAMRDHVAAESRARVRAGEAALDEVIAALDTLHPEPVAALVLALRAADQPPT
jgi:hypothetical protein